MFLGEVQLRCGCEVTFDTEIEFIDLVRRHIASSTEVLTVHVEKVSERE